MKIHRLLLWGLICLLQISGTSFAQGQANVIQIPVTVAEKPAVPPPPPELEAMMAPYRAGQFEVFVKNATAALDKMEKPDPYISYWRGSAERRLGWLEAAEKDYAPLGDFVAWPKYPAASKEAADLKQLLELRPSQEREIRVGDKVVFRVYYTRDDEFTESAMQALPISYQAASTIFRNQISEIPVYLFEPDEYDRFFKFYSLLHTPPHSWWRVLSSSGSITVSQSDSNGNILQPDVNSYARYFAHELTHVNFQRTLGRIPDFPNWFNEGAAQLVESNLSPSMLAQNDRTIQRLVDQNAILPLNRITTNADFHENVDSTKAGQGQSDPYAQGLNMTRYLGFVMRGAKLSDFVRQVQQKRSFEAAITASTGLTLAEFYAEWLKEISE